jgi:hypothetical protein
MEKEILEEIKSLEQSVNKFIKERTEIGGLGKSHVRAYCDAPGCNYEKYLNFDKGHSMGDFLDKPCPKCGKIIITEDDLMKWVADISELLDLMNKIESDIEKNPEIGDLLRASSVVLKSVQKSSLEPFGHFREEKNSIEEEGA